jgi:hypothetical protein
LHPLEKRRLLTAHATSGHCFQLDQPTSPMQDPLNNSLLLPSYLYAIAALDGPVKGMTAKLLNPTSRHQLAKSEPE